MTYWIYILAGIYLIVFGVFSKGGFINESDVSATNEERRNAKATPLKRMIVVTGGVAAFVYGVVHVLHRA
jgi:hypothetical protein